MKELVVIIIVVFFILLATAKSQDLEDSDSEFRDAEVVQMLGFRSCTSRGGWRILVEFGDDGLEPSKMILTISRGRYDRLMIGDKIKVYCGTKSSDRN